MSDVFLSYAREDQPKAEALAHALEAQGLSVWWDRHVVAGDAFDDTIEHELETAGSVVVLWSEASVRSEWVRSEASSAAERGVLVPASIDGHRPPLEFRRKQTVALADWNGRADHEGFGQLLQATRLRAATGSVAAAAPRPVVRRPAAAGKRRWGLIALAAILAAILFGLFKGRVAESPASSPEAAIPAAPPARHSYRWTLAASNIDDDVHVEINAIERFSRWGGQASFDLTPFLTGGNDRVLVRLGNGKCFASSLHLQFLRDGKPRGEPARYYTALSHCGWQLEWEWIISRTSGEIRRVK
ncbi:MAG: toll/interleukin-1 receptor domain-containing protein [Rhodocyclaceae bacterium]|nr:toll/interleukin-1 receptor domain-containing protein [Rhodocyclaceae bacterium]